MALAPGTRLGAYEITGQIGAGGMGEVYRARDTRLNRDVAIKVLPDAFTHDPDRLARFTREAHLLASLNHPHIGAIYGIEDDCGQARTHPGAGRRRHAGRPDRRGRIPLHDALPIARQICEALRDRARAGDHPSRSEAVEHQAHARRHVKVLDFGLAKLGHPDAVSGRDVTLSPTITSPAMMTTAGVVLGTAAYMSPEQAKGREADKRSDVWAFGCVLYEMLSGRRAFDGEDMTDVLGAVVRLEPEWQALPADVPAAIRTLLQQSLVKDRRKRIADLAAARFVLDDQTLAATSIVPPVAAPQRLGWLRVAVPDYGGTHHRGSGSDARSICAAPGARACRAFDSRNVRVDGIGVVGAVAGPGHHARRAECRLSWQQSAADSCARPARVTRAGTSCATQPLHLAGRTVGRVLRRQHDEESGHHRWSARDPDTVQGDAAGATWGPDGTIVFATGDASAV